MLKRIGKLTNRYKALYPNLSNKEIAQLVKKTIKGRTWGIRRSLLGKFEKK